MERAILIVEDDEDLREMLVESLEDEGYRAVGAADAQQALKLAERRKFDLVVTDVRMGGMDGLDCLAELRRRQPGVRSIVITGYASDDAPTRALRQQASDYLYKPFTLDDLLLSVGRAFQVEQETARSQSLLARLVSGYRSVMEAASAALASRQLSGMEQDRAQVFCSYYVGVRSRKLGMHEALALWDRLEGLEAARQELKGAKFQLKEGQSLAEGYRYVLQLLEAFSRGAPPVTAQREPGRVSRQRFAEFYRKILQGEFPPAQLQLAPFLRRLSMIQLSQSPELLELYRSIWGDPRSDGAATS
ncbi:MAG: response regulator [Armatimonadetes bacterium]|nr:response regulator [Armatimonadota bacterium]